MKRWVCSIVLGALAAALPAGATHEVSGMLLVANPNGAITAGVTEERAACDPASPLNGIDGKWFALPNHGFQQAVLTPLGANAAATDLAAYFYDSQCDLISYFNMGGLGPEELGAVERGIVPQNARMVIVNLIVGAQASFRLTFTRLS